MAKQESRKSYLKDFHFRKMICTAAVSEFLDELKRQFKWLFDQSVVPFLLNGFIVSPAIVKHGYNMYRGPIGRKKVFKHRSFSEPFKCVFIFIF